MGAVIRDELVRLSFKLPGTNTLIEAGGQVVWSNELERWRDITDLSAETLQQVRD